jgi:hypothetical protein
MHSLESIPELLKRLQIRTLAGRYDNHIPTPFLAPINCYKITVQESIPQNRFLVISNSVCGLILGRGAGRPDNEVDYSVGII